MFSENHYFMTLDFALQPFIESVQESISDLIPKPKSDSDKVSDKKD